MAAADPQIFPYTATIAVTSYPAAPQISSFPGWLSVSHNGASTDPDLYISQNGVDDAIILSPGMAWNSPVGTLSGRYWFKLSGAGSVAVKAIVVNHQAGA
jgi:hypothetical protein